MILTVTLNLALDVTYHVPRIAVDRAHRVADVAQRAGGKGVNVARVLHARGRETLVCGLAGGATGDVARAELGAAGMPEALGRIAGETRRTLTVVDESRGSATSFWEPGPTVSAEEWGRFLASFDGLLDGTRAVVLSGSLPSGVPSEAYALLCERAARAEVPVLLDADGDALRLGLPARPAIVKPNREELTRATGERDPVAAAELLVAAGARAVVASLGPDGLIAVTPDGRWRAAPAEHVTGNPTGAGDAAVAALISGLLDGWTWPERLVDAVALSAAAVSAPLAGSFDPVTYRRHLARARVDTLATSGAAWSA
jgi:tagatose 6-phosphate kinase